MERGTAVLLTVVAAALWGTSFAVNDAGVRLLDPSLFTFWRFGLAAAGSLAVAAAVGAFSLQAYREPVVWALGGLTAGAFFLQHAGQTLTTPARTALFVNANVLVVALLSWLALRQPPRARTLGAMAVALFGVVLLQSRGEVGSYQGGTPTGDLLTFLSGTCSAGLFVLLPRALTRTNPYNLIAAMFTITAVIALPITLLTGPDAFFPTKDAWWFLGYAALFTSTLAYTLWAFSMHRLTPTTSAVLLLLEVLVAAALSLGLGRETFTLAAAGGAALLLAGVVWLSAEPNPV